MPNDNVVEFCDLIKSYINDSAFQNKIIELIKWAFLLSNDFDNAPLVKCYPKYIKNIEEETGKWAGLFLKDRDHPFLKIYLLKNNRIDQNWGLFHIPINALKNQSGPFKIYPGNAGNWARITAKEFDILPNTHELQECIEDSYRLRLNELGIYTNKKTNPVSFSAKDSDQISDRSEEAEKEEKPANKPIVPPSNRIYYGPPGTGKTYKLSQMLKRNYEQPAGSVQRYSFVTFHQSYGYEEFIEGLRPLLDGDAESNELQYEIRPGVFKELCRKARSAPDQRFAMVIDEINRGNISKIFGELITLIEPDKREGTENAVAVTLPYSGESFSVPANVDIIGTMNTADRSLALLDTALRRRFDFEPVMPDSRDEPGAPLHGLRVAHDQKIIDIPRMLTAINRRVEALYDRDHTIGHAYFTSLASVLDDGQRFEALGQIFRNRIVPLLEEYFFEDWQKIRLVLADNQKEESACFITMTENHEDNLNSLFGNDHGLDAFTTKRCYVLQESAFSNPDAYIGIYQTLAL